MVNVNLYSTLSRSLYCTEIGCELVLFINRQSQMSFWLVLKSETLNGMIVISVSFHWKSGLWMRSVLSLQ